MLVQMGWEVKVIGNVKGQGWGQGLGQDHFKGRFSKAFYNAKIYQKDILIGTRVLIFNECYFSQILKHAHMRLLMAPAEKLGVEDKTIGKQLISKR